MSEKIKPFSMRYTDAKKEIFDSVNNAVQIHGVPFFLIEGIVTELLRQVQENAAIEREREKAEYEKPLAAEETKEGD